MNFDEAISAHVAWKTRLRGCIEGQEKMEALTVAKDDACALGKWIHGEGKSHDGLAEFQALRERHAAFHKAAAEIVADVNAGRKTEAGAKLDELGGAYTKESTAVVQAIRAMRQASAAT